MGSLKRSVSILEEDKEILDVIPIRISNDDADITKPQSAPSRLSLEDYHKNLTEDESIERLYTNVIIQTLNRCSGLRQISHDTLLEYAWNAFKIPQDKHLELMHVADATPQPKIRLNVDIIKAENLTSKDSNGLSDPFVTVSFKSNPAETSKSSIKLKTLNPTWNERCSLFVPPNFCSEQLVVQVWDYDEVETIGNKLKQISDVPNITCLGRYFKELTSSANQTLIGSFQIPLEEIPAGGKKAWFPLKKDPLSNKNKGSLLVNITFGSHLEPNRTVLEDHQKLLKILLSHELQQTKSKPYEWKGQFRSRALAIITQHIIQCGLTENDSAFCQWEAYTCLHKCHPLSFTLFSAVLEKINLKVCPEKSELVQDFWNSLKDFLPSCFYLVHDIQSLSSIDELESVCNILNTIDTLNRPTDVVLFPESSYEWLKDLGQDTPTDDIKLILMNAIWFGVKNWINSMNNNLKKDNFDPIQQQTKLIQQMRSDLQLDMRKQQHKAFNKALKINFCHTLCKYYHKYLEGTCKQLISDTCKQIIPPIFGDDISNVVQEDQAEYFLKCTHLFELYLNLRSFASFWAQVSPESDQLSVYRDWFEPARRHWLDMSEIKALFAIQKAIELDNFKPLEGANTRYSSSVLDTLSILNQVKIFWQQLDLPYIEESFACLTRLVYGICRSWIYYATRVETKIFQFIKLEDRFGNFKITSEWCLSICSINQLQKNLPSLIKELGVDSALENMKTSMSKNDLERCSRTIDSLIENAQETMQQRIDSSIEVVVNKIAIVIRKFLNEAAKEMETNCHAVEEMYSYLESTLMVVHAELPEATFQNFIDKIWHKFSLLLSVFIKQNIDKPQSFFSNLHQVLQTMEKSFRDENMSLKNRTTKLLAENKKLIILHSLETYELIHQFYHQQYDLQKSMESPSLYGQLTVAASFTKENVLLVNVLNANSLMPMDSNKLCDSFVTIQYIPSDRFIELAHHKTQTQHKTLTPLYDEEFEVRLTSYQANQGDNMLLFIVSDSDLFGMKSEYLAECYLSFNDIRKSKGQQIRMNLSRPIYPSDSEYLRVLKSRKINDETARSFIKNIKSKQDKK